MPSRTIFFFFGTRPWIKLPERFNPSLKFTLIFEYVLQLTAVPITAPRAALWSWAAFPGSGMGIPWRGCSCSSQGTRSMFQVVLGCCGHLHGWQMEHLWWKNCPDSSATFAKFWNLGGALICAGEMQMWSWGNTAGSKGRWGKVRSFYPQRWCKIGFLTDKTICYMVENYRRPSFMLVSIIRRLSRTLGLTWAQSGGFLSKILVQIPVLASHCNRV